MASPSSIRDAGLLFAAAVLDLRKDDFSSAEPQFRLLMNHPLTPKADRPSMEFYLSWAVLGKELELQKVKILKISNKVITQSGLHPSSQLFAGAKEGVNEGLPRLSYEASSGQKLVKAEINEFRRIAARISPIREQSKALFGPASWQMKELVQMNTKILDCLVVYCRMYGLALVSHGGTRFSLENCQWRPSSVPPASRPREFPAVTGNHELKATAEASSVNDSHTAWTAGEYDAKRASLMAKIHSILDDSRSEAQPIPSRSIGNDSLIQARSTRASIIQSPPESFRPASAPPSDSMSEESRQSVAAQPRPHNTSLGLGISLQDAVLPLPQDSDRKLNQAEALLSLIRLPLPGFRTLESFPATKFQTRASVYIRGLGSALAEPDFTNFDVRVEPDTPRGEAPGVKRWFERHKNEVQSFMEPMRRDRGDKVKVAILDTGFEADNTNPSVQGLWRNIDRKHRWKSWVSNAAIMEDANGHGTHCALSLHEIAPAADLYIGRVCVNGIDLTGETVAKAITHCVNEWNVDIISMSFGFPHASTALQALAPAIEHAAKHNTLIFAAAGNGGTGNPRTYPASYDHVFCIFSACDQGRPSASNPNPLVRDWNFCCLGEHVTMPRSESPNKTMSGSSVATPIAAGFAALVLEFHRQPKITNQLPIRKPEKLKTMKGMCAVFLKMIQHDAEVITDAQGCWRPIEPWNLLCVPFVLKTGSADDALEPRRIRVPLKINEALESIP